MFLIITIELVSRVAVELFKWLPAHMTNWWETTWQCHSLSFFCSAERPRLIFSPPASFPEGKVSERLRWSSRWPPDTDALHGPNLGFNRVWADGGRRPQALTSNNGWRAGWWSPARRQRGWCRFDLSRSWKPVCFVYLLWPQPALDICCFFFFLPFFFASLWNCCGLPSRHGFPSRVKVVPQRGTTSCWMIIWKW